MWVQLLHPLNVFQEYSRRWFPRLDDVADSGSTIVFFSPGTCDIDVYQDGAISQMQIDVTADKCAGSI